MNILALSPAELDLDEFDFHPHDHESFDQAGEIFALYQNPPGKGLGWFTWCADDWTKAWASSTSGITWYDDVVHLAGNWAETLKGLAGSLTALDLGSGINAFSFTTAAIATVADTPKEFYVTFSFTPDRARVGVLPAGRWVWRWADLAPSEHSTAIQQAIFSTDKDHTS